ncbi:Glucosidase 2 subunit beta [Nymphaea thermarum]|nr:Glucosidase 2 subunit beta [Nymphaea thermarum]
MQVITAQLDVYKLHRFQGLTFPFILISIWNCELSSRLGTGPLDKKNPEIVKGMPDWALESCYRSDRTRKGRAASPESRDEVLDPELTELSLSSIPSQIRILSEIYLPISWNLSRRDGSKFFPRERLNDGFCDCSDGTDEPGTSSCPESKFYCRNVGSTPILLFSSRVNDHICDCCDGTDENDGKVICPYTCINNGAIQIEILQDKVQQTELVNLDILDDRQQVNKDDIVHKFEGLKVMVLLEVMLLGCIIFFRICYRQIRYRRTHQ